MHWRAEAAKLLPLYSGDDPELAETLLAELAEDDVPLVREAAAGGLAVLIESLEPLSRTPLLSRWALSKRPRKREAIARALGADVYLIGAPTALGVLAGDSYASVRAAATRAAASRVERAPSLYLPLLRRGLKDNRRPVRFAALDGLRRAAKLGLLDVDDDLIDAVGDAETSTALTALSTIEAIGYRNAEQGLAALERLAESCDDLADEVVEHLVARLESMEGDRVRRDRALRTIRHSRSCSDRSSDRSWLDDDAAVAIA